MAERAPVGILLAMMVVTEAVCAAAHRHLFSEGRTS
jgi:hypothetical protein